MKRREKIQSNLERIADDLAKLSDTSSRVRYLARHPRCRRTAVVRQLVEASRTNLRIDTRKALSLANAAITIARRLKGKDDLAAALRSKGNALYVLGDNEAALKYNSQALSIFCGTRNAAQQGRTLNASIQPNILLGNYEQAFEAADAAQQIFSRLGDTRHLAHLQINRGNIYHRQDRFEEGLTCYQNAYEMLAPLRDSEGLAVALYNISVCLISLNDFYRALTTYRRAREICAREGMTLLVGQADYNIAYLYYLRGEYARAIRMLQAARELSEKAGDEHILALCYLDLSDIYLELNLTGESVEMAREGFLRFDRLGMGYERAKCLANEALALSQFGSPRRALDLFAQARAAFVQEKNRVWPWLIDLYRGLVLRNQGHIPEAREACQKAFEFFCSSGLQGRAVLCCLLLGRIELDAGNAEAARKHCEQADRMLSTLELPALNFQARLLAAQINHAVGDRKAAYSAYLSAHEALEDLRSRLLKDEFKIAFMKNKSEVYERLVELCLEGEDTKSSEKEAFRYIELAKSRSLMDLVSHAAGQTAGDRPLETEAVRQIRDLRDNLNWYYRRIEHELLRPEAASSDRIARLQNHANTCEKAILRTIRELPDSNPEAALQREFIDVSLEEIQAGIGSDTLLVEYFCVGDRLIALLISSRDLKVLQISSASRVVSLLQLLRFQLSKFSLGSKYLCRFENTLFEAAQRHLRELYRELLEPISELPKYAHLVFVPHGALYSVPFHALFDGECHLIDRFSVSYSPSASIYRSCQNRQTGAGKTSLILGISDARAPSIDNEIAGIATIVKDAVLFSGQAATEEVLREKGMQSRVIHISTHGSFRQDNPMFSRIRLGDSYLSVVDLYHLRLPAHLITLSGCGTGLNAVMPGDEPVGLMRGFLCAGARSLLLTMWDVHDESTTGFMNAFYRHLMAGATKAQSIRLAMQQTRDLYPHPYFWGPFFLVGACLEGITND